MQSRKIKAWLPAIRVGTGVDVFTQRLADALARHGISTQISWFPSQFELAPMLLKFVPLPAGTDIVFANSWNGFAFKRAGVPLVVTVHHSGSDTSVHSYRTRAQRIYHRFMIEPFETRSYQAADAVTAVSKFSSDSVQRAAGIKHVYPIHNWVDVNRFQPAPVVRPQNLRPFRLLFVGKPSRSKGADLLAPIMQQLGQDFELRVAGRIDPAQSAHYPANIHVLGWLNEERLIRAYQNCDGLLLPSRSEGFGYAALEAMACGKPVIGSNATALPEVVAHGVTGLLCTPGDITAFVAACRYLAHNPEEHRQMGEAARQRALEQFSETIAMTQYLELIDRRTQH